MISKKILNYTLIIVGFIFVLVGIIQDYDGFTIIGVILILSPLIISDVLIKRNKKHN
jgi:hypothetical protein